VGLLFAIYSPADWTALPRYFAPYLPASLILLWAGILTAVELFVSSSASTNSKPALIATIAGILVLTTFFDHRTQMANMEEFPGFVLSGKNLIGPSDWMQKHLPPKAVIATRRIGIVAYHSQRKIFDYMYGLPDAEVARLVARHRQHFDLPTDPKLADLWQTRKPDYLLEDRLLIDRLVLQSGSNTPEEFTIHGIRYRVIRQFPIGHEAFWVLSQRIGP
jgi:hypothetical protein